MGIKPIGITGFKCVGKDTLANLIIEKNSSFKKYSMADPIRDIGRIFGFTEEDMLNPMLKEMPNEFWQISWRSFAQIIGTDMFRESYRQDVWVKLAEKNILSSDKFLVIPDIRFDNEAELIKKYSGIVIRVLRNGYGGGQHKSEAGINEKYIDIDIYNNGLIVDMNDGVEKIISRHGC